MSSYVELKGNLVEFFHVFRFIIYRLYWFWRYRHDPETVLVDILKKFESYMYSARPLILAKNGTRRRRASSLSPVTIGGYLRILKKVLKDMGTVVPTKKAARIWLVKLKKENYSWSHCSNSAAALEWFLRFWGITFRAVKPLKPHTKTKEFLTEDEINQLFQVCRSDRDRALVSALAYSGLRCNEICHVKVGHINFKTQSIFCEKGKGGGNATLVSAKFASNT